MRRYAFIFALVIAVSFLQTTELISVGGVRPNLTLALLVALSYAARSPSFVAAAVAAALVVLSRGIRIERGALLVGLLVLLGFVGGRRLPGKPFLNTMSMAFAGTFLFYAFLDARFLGTHLPLIFAEAAANSVAALLSFAAISRIVRPSHETKTRTPG